MLTLGGLCLIAGSFCGGGAVLVSAAVAPCAAVDEPLPATLVAGVLAVVITALVAATAPGCEGCAGNEGESEERKLHSECGLKRRLLKLL